RPEIRTPSPAPCWPSRTTRGQRLEWGSRAADGPSSGFRARPASAPSRMRFLRRWAVRPRPVPCYPRPPHPPSTNPKMPLPATVESSPQKLVPEIRKYFDREHRKHPSCLLYNTTANNFLIPSETYARELLGDFDAGLRILEIGSGDSVDSCALAGRTNTLWGI